MTTNDAGSAPLHAPVRPVLSPRDWQALAVCCKLLTTDTCNQHQRRCRAASHWTNCAKPGERLRRLGFVGPSGLLSRALNNNNNNNNNRRIDAV